MPPTQWGKQSTKSYLRKPLEDFNDGSMTPASLSGCRRIFGMAAEQESLAEELGKKVGFGGGSSGLGNQTGPSGYRIFPPTQSRDG